MPVPTRFERFKIFGAISNGALTHVSLTSPDSDVTGVSSDTPIHGLFVVNYSAAYLTFNVQGVPARVAPGATGSIEVGSPIRAYNFTPNAAVNASEIQIVHKGPAVPAVS